MVMMPHPRKERGVMMDGDDADADDDMIIFIVMVFSV